MDTYLEDGAAALTAAQWESLHGTGRADRSQGYARFREHMEPGTPLLLTAADAAGRCAALHGTLTTPASGLFSHPWKLLTAEQMLRPEENGGEQARADHAELLRAVVGTGSGAGGGSGEGGGAGERPDAAALTAVLGEAIVFRGFDSTEAGLRTGLDGATRHQALLALLEGARDAVRAGTAGAVCLPFVREDDEPLRTALGELGFRSAVLTAVSDFDLTGVSSYEEYVAALPSRRRRTYRKEEQAMADSALRIDTWPLAGHVAQVAALEARNVAKYGGRPDPEVLIAARSAMAELLGHQVRVAVAVRPDGGPAAGEPAACGIHMADDHSYCILMYGADDTVADGGPAYPCLTFYEPLRYAADHGLATVRLGFEAFSAKLRRGARLSRRETWIWTPDGDRLAALHRVMEFLAARTATHFEHLIGHAA
ncbi:GNAT family N-acetyltransferase [Streptomyces rimosus]|uniref:GNAT family N-acetyltransferase n=1 Tax=Streptomyces rimosus TaxID=1927 RepID=UPI0004CB0AF9|nr:GNAT family N-acetyltransferase [Streptomyces rimosus]